MTDRSPVTDLQLLRVAAEARSHRMNTGEQITGLERLQSEGAVARWPWCWRLTSEGRQLLERLEKIAKETEL